MALTPDVLLAALREDLDEWWDLIQHELPFDCGYQAVAAWQLRRSLFKKYVETNTSTADSAALAKFLSSNDRCGNWTLQLTSWSDELLYGTFKDLVWEFFHENSDACRPLFTDPLEILDHGEFGPGATTGSPGGDLYTKLFSSKLDCTSLRLYHWYRIHIQGRPDWSKAEVLRLFSHGRPRCVEGNRLSFVPKEREISRTICTEPTLNMWYQRGLGELLSKRITRLYGLNPADQQFRNRKLALLGSKYGDYATIDLSSASDTISLKLLEKIIPRASFNWFLETRSPHVRLPDGTIRKLEMISSMGNGFTFPLETVIFTCATLAAMEISGVKPVYPNGDFLGNFGVFGDDIICPTVAVRYLYRLLDILGFEVNRKKSFAEGPFRESCGSDYFRGWNVRGVYIKSIQTQQDRLAAINQLNLFSARTGISLKKTVRALLKTVEFLPVPFSEGDSSGIKVPSSMLKIRLHRNYQTPVYWRWEPVGKRIRIGDGYFALPKGHRARSFNPPGLYLSFVAGAINSYTIGVRHDPVLYRRKLACIPFWDYVPSIHSQGWLDWQRWESAVYRNLSR